MRTPSAIRSMLIAAIAALVLAAGCGQAGPVVLPPGDAEVLLGSELQSHGQVLEVQPDGNDGRLAGAEALADSAGATAAATGEQTSTTVTAQSATNVTAATTATSTVATSTPGSSTASSTTATSTTVTPTPAPSTTEASDQTSAPTTGTDGGAPIVEFRIAAGTGGGSWNAFDEPVRVTVGQVLRIHNDDTVPHTAHSNGTPFRHGPTIQPGGFADHEIVATLTPDPAVPANYEHDRGPAAPFWVVATEAGTATSESPEPAAAAGSSALVAAEAESLRLLNELRSSLGVQPVTPSDPEMHSFARQWSLEMRRTGFRHSDPPPWFENIVWYSDETMTPEQAAAQFHDMWVNSPGHYQNMTNPDWSIVGIGMWHDESGWWGVHVFR